MAIEDDDLVARVTASIMVALEPSLSRLEDAFEMNLKAAMKDMLTKADLAEAMRGIEYRLDRRDARLGALERSPFVPISSLRRPRQFYATVHHTSGLPDRIRVGYSG